jgi:hypothetical protein
MAPQSIDRYSRLAAALRSAQDSHLTPLMAEALGPYPGDSIKGAESEQYSLHISAGLVRGAK